MKNIRKQSGIIPGFGLSLGYTVVYVSLLVLFPLSVLVISTSSLSWDQFLSIVLADRVIASYKLSFLAALGAALVNTVFGLLIAWVLVRYRFPGKKILDGLVDLPFALPTAVAGISLTAVYAPNGWIGQYIEPLGIKVAFTSLGVTVAFIFIGIPFVIRTVQPVLHDVDRQMEEAASSLGATRWITFWRVIFPQLVPALLTGFTLALARAVGEYGSVVFISGNMPMKTEITPLLIMTKLEQFDYAGATAIASVMLLLSFVILLLTNILQWWSRKMYRMDT
ncbi:sulfate ABC transporter permease subunit CysT [Brevibacillus laterosporus]|uniref:sulfate ABC transporter permease subunit CysT n=1 Tax=Brevibacillus laterosporus TaxID=1465 RepID=UPI00264B11A8|nr:sulfate ABC transporter permease subunit CysT [Brevibacillus laterosporus]MDN9011378.1 sulfate ABC transporter permease subunit CysT [Brevibacillus laterosporus]MDO0942444.1 sulfate ABC transporter permease subunit CysT [Brevibacillus laterosporus]